jgi:hypothetical protein
LLALVFVSQAARAQGAGEGTVSGTVLSTWDGTPLPSVVVSVRGTTLATQTDGSGRFELQRVPPGEQVLIFSKSGYNRTSVEEVRVLTGQTSRADVRLNPEFYELDTYEVVSELFEEQDSMLMFERQSASSMIESIGSERFSQLAAGDAAEIMTKITGVSVVEGKFAVIRGLSDRYNLALLNGAEVPSADPYRRAAQLDMFPSEVIEDVVVSKTFTPDLPGGFAGGVMDIHTKSFPDRFIFKVSIGAGYNTQSTGNDDFLTYPGGGTDYLAMDDDTRALPSDLEGVTGDDLTELLQTATSGSRTIPLSEKTAAAQEMDDLTRSFGTPYMGPERSAPGPDFDFSTLVGDTVHLGSVPVGFFAGLSYERDYRFYEDGVRQRYTPTPGGGDLALYQDYEDSRSLTLTLWSALASLAIRPFEHHEVGYTFLYTQNSEDQVRTLYGQIESSGEDQFGSDRRTHLNTLYWLERNLTTHQFHGEHVFPELSDFETDWLVSLAETSQYEPDLRYFNFISEPDPNNPESALRRVIFDSNTPFPNKPTRYWRNLEDQNLNAKLDLTLPVEDGRGLTWKAKAGLYTSQSERTFEERSFSYSGGDGTIADTETFPYEYMSDEFAPPPELIIQGSRPPRYVLSRSLSSTFGNNFYEGEQDINALYAMGEVPVLPWLRLTGGARYETTLLEVVSTAFQSSETFTGTIDEADLLPALNLTIELRKGMNLRLSYSETVARPTYREFARYRSYDAVGDQLVEGNPFLVMTHIQNLDARWEWFTQSGGLLSFGGFYKILEDPIEKYNATLDAEGNPIWTGSGDFVTFLNTEEAKVWGLELETRQSLGVLTEALRPFSIGLNAALIQSEVQITEDLQALKLGATGEAEDTRPLYDQSPYIINVDLTYNLEPTGTQITVAYYYAAERLALISNLNYDIYEQPAPSLDVVISQKLGKGFKAKFSARNLLNPEVLYTYGVDGPTDTEYVYSSYRKGLTFNLSLSYEF